MGKNIELKSRLGDLAEARKILATLEARYVGCQEQIDTYFRVGQGRLKLRQINGLQAELIWYDRPDQPQARCSLYYRAPVANPETVKTVLAAALGIRGVVQKRREIFLWQNVRIHLDELPGMGTFLEFEAMLGPDQGEAEAQTQLAHLVQIFHIQSEDLLAGSYADLKEEKLPSR
ncbi:MAG: class IV adenylate cyclase [Thermoguttaceae bacterium]|nr:class IV adenylate cyclase [Thermoguttaceae bacterium]MDW8039102.1 class IV adenylate cyclase [Thermoguttaceae bacterium]